MNKTSLSFLRPDVDLGPLSDEQRAAAYCAFSGKSVVVPACAGSGKSHTSRAVGKCYSGMVAFISFMVSLREEQKAAMGHYEHITIESVHALAKKMNGGKLDKKKLQKIAENLFGKSGRKVSELVKAMKTEGYGIYDNALTVEEIADKYSIRFKDSELGDDSIEDMAEAVLAASDKDTVNVDFEDMLRHCVLNNKLRILKGLCIFDEVQDFTPLIWTFIQKCITTAETQIFMIGDPERQALMMFAGARTEIFEEMAEHYGAERFALTVNRRCSKAVVANAPHKGDMVALPDAPEGFVGQRSKVDVIEEVMEGEHKENAIISETNANIVTLGIQLLTQGTPVRMRTARLDSLLYRYAFKHLVNRKLKVGDMTPLLQAELAEVAADGGDVAEFQDVVKCIEALETYCIANDITKTAWKFRRPQHPLQQALEILTSGEKGVTLLTGHTAKGLEWETVFHLPANMKAPEQEWQVRQNECLAHVIATRAILNFITLTD